MTNTIKMSKEIISLFHNNRIVNNPVDVGIILNNSSTLAASEIGSEYPIQDDENTDRKFQDYVYIKWEYWSTM